MTKKEPTGVSPTTYHSLLKDISQIYEVALTDGNAQPLRAEAGGTKPRYTLTGR